METSVKKLDGSRVSITITVQPDEYKKFVDGALIRLNDAIEIKGFRKGKAPTEEIIKKVGEVGVYQEALQRIIPAFFTKAVEQEKLETVGAPEVNVDKLAPNNPLVFTVTTSLLPGVTLPDFTKIKVEEKEITIEPKKVDDVLDTVKKMRAKEVLSTNAADKNSKLMVDMRISVDGVPVEGGQALNHGIYLDEDYYIPGMNAQLMGLKKDDAKEFELTFPENHYQKNLAGKKAVFSVKVKDVFTRELPVLDDEFAKGLGQESVDKLRELISNNLYEEAHQKEHQRYEIALLDAMIEATKFGELPEVIVSAEKEKMIAELKRSLEKNGVSLEKYLSDLKKTESDLRTEWSKEAEKRAKAALLSRAFAKEKGITVTDEELEEEKNKIRDAYKDVEDLEERLTDPGVLSGLMTVVQNRKVIAEIKKLIGAKHQH